jgi:hypothetical protein
MLPGAAGAHFAVSKPQDVFSGVAKDGETQIPLCYDRSRLSSAFWAFTVPPFAAV